MVNPRLLLGCIKRKSVGGFVLDEPLLPTSPFRIDAHLLNLDKYNFFGHRIHDAVAMTSIHAHRYAMSTVKGDLSTYQALQLTRASLAQYRDIVPALYPYMELFVEAASSTWTSYLSHDQERFYIRLSATKPMGILVFAIKRNVEAELPPVSTAATAGSLYGNTAILPPPPPPLHPYARTNHYFSSPFV